MCRIAVLSLDDAPEAVIKQLGVVPNLLWPRSAAMSVERPKFTQGRRRSRASRPGFHAGER